MRDENQDEVQTNDSLLPEWDDGGDVDEATWVAALEESRRQQFAELADL